MMRRKARFMIGFMLFVFTISVFAPAYACAENCVFDAEIQACDSDCNGSYSQHENHTFHINGHHCGGHSLALISDKAVSFKTPESKDKFKIWSDTQHPKSIIFGLERPPRAYLFA